MRLGRAVLGVVAAGWLGQGLAAAAEGQGVRVAATARPEADGWNARVERMLREGALSVGRVQEDTLLPGRKHQRLGQLHRGVPVRDGEVIRQFDEAGAVVSVLGKVYENIDLDPRPTLTAEQAKAIVEKRSGTRLGALIIPQLTVLPLDGGGYALTYTLTAAADGDVRRYFVDAGDGRVIIEYSDVHRQTPAVGRGRGVLNDEQKISAASLGGSFFALDLLRPARLLTFDLKGNPAKAEALFNGLIVLGDADVATDADNEWTDGAVVDAHAYAGYVYDYFFKRFGRRGWDDRNLRIPSLVHPVRREDFFALPQFQGLYFLNAFFCCKDLGGFMVYGEGAPVTVDGQSWNRLAGGLDVAAHEITHGMTAFSSGLDNRFCLAGGLNESFSDMMGVSVDFFHRPSTANYRIGEDVVTPGGIRDMANPASRSSAGGLPDPDHVAAVRVCEVHYLAGVPNQAFYLAIEGGRNRTSGLSVQGVGPTNREQIEKVFYRGFTFGLTPTAGYLDAAVATVLSAQQLYGRGSAVERAVLQAWIAVGVL